MIYGVSGNLNHQIWTRNELTMDFRSSLEKKKKNIWAIPKLCPRRSLAPQRTGPTQQLSCAGRGGDVERGFRKCAYAQGKRMRWKPSPLKQAGPAHWVTDVRVPAAGRLKPPARCSAKQRRRGRAGAGVLPGGTGHLRRRPAYQRAQESVPHPPRCATTAGVAGREHIIGRSGEAGGGDGTRQHGHGKEREKHGRGSWWWWRCSSVV